MRPRDDIDLDRTWIISDTHFGHKNIIGYCHRPENFEDILLEELSVIPEGDTLLHLGDLCYRGNTWFKNMIAPKIAPDAARLLLVKGNHDHQRYSFYKQSRWKIVSPFYIPLADAGGYLVPGEGQADWVVSFSHYQWSNISSDGKLDWEREYMDQKHWRLHGHIHNNGYFDGRGFSPPRWELVPYLAQHVNLSCEMTKYKPVNLRLLLDAVLLGKMPEGKRKPSLDDLLSDGSSPTRSEIGGANAHVQYSRGKVG